MAAQNLVEKYKRKGKISRRSALMTGGFLEMNSSRVYAEYIEHSGKRRWGAYLRASCETVNTVDVFKSVSQVVVSPADRPAL